MITIVSRRAETDAKHFLRYKSKASQQGETPHETRFDFMEIGKKIFNYFVLPKFQTSVLLIRA